jgi:hypothetical protein
MPRPDDGCDVGAGHVRLTLSKSLGHILIDKTQGSVCSPDATAPFGCGSVTAPVGQEMLALLPQTSEGIQRKLQILRGVGGGDADAQAGGALRYGGEQNRRDYDIVLAQAAGK